jgi:hypothetical protein
MPGFKEHVTAMRTRLLLSASAIVMMALGLIATFAPQETLAALGSTSDGLAVLLVQVAGALYLGWATVNWMSRANLIGGIYNRPVALGNFLHFAVVALASLKMLIAGHRPPVLVAGAVVYATFCVWFGLVVFTHPGQAAKGRD